MDQSYGLHINGEVVDAISGATLPVENPATGEVVTHGADALDVGIVWINHHHRIDPSSPWSGRKDSGIGQENGLDGYRAYTVPKSIIVNTSDQHSDWFGFDEDARYS